MSENRKLHVIMLRTAAVLLFLVLLSTGMVAGRYARYVSSSSGEDLARVAKFTVSQSVLLGETDLTETIPVPEIKPGDTVEFFIKVEHDTETAVRNTIEVTNLYGNLPLTFSLQETGTTQPLSVSPFVFDYGPGTFTKDYTLFIHWPESQDESDTDYIGMVDLLSISITSEQID